MFAHVCQQPGSGPVLLKGITVFRSYLLIPHINLKSAYFQYVSTAANISIQCNVGIVMPKKIIKVSRHTHIIGNHFCETGKSAATESSYLAKSTGSFGRNFTDYGDPPPLPHGFFMACAKTGTDRKANGAVHTDTSTQT